MAHYGLFEFFREYKFNGLIWTRDGESPFELEVFDYEGCTGLFVGSGRDNHGLSAIIGKIQQQSAELALVNFRQVFNSKRPTLFTCELTKTSEDVFLQGAYNDPQDKKKYSIRLATSLRC